MAARGQDDLSQVTAGQGDIFISAEPHSWLIEHSSFSLDKRVGSIYNSCRGFLLT